MKKLLLLLLFTPVLLIASPIDPSSALKIANNFMNAPQKDSMGNIRKGKVNKKMVANEQTIDSDQQFYIFNSTDGQGFVIVSADDISYPILGYSFGSSIDIETMPQVMKDWLNEYSRQIKWGQENDLTGDDEIKSAWKKIIAGDVDYGNIVVSPLVSTKWNQDKYYNSKCPETLISTLGSDGHVYAGCVACSMAQIMKYYEWPIKGNGSHTNTKNPTYGNQYANFGNTTYNWSQMPIQLTSSSSSAQVSAVATLMYHCGVAMDMDYSYKGSGADPSNIPAAMVQYFRYSELAQNVKRDERTKWSWYMIIMDQLQKGRPLFFGGYPLSTSKEGHSFICDGYTSDFYFHFNFGWSGAYDDAYFKLEAVNPGTYDFSYRQQIVVNCVPQGSVEFDSLQLVSEWNHDDVVMGNGEFNAAVNIGVISRKNFSGNLYAVIFDSLGNYVKIIDSLKNCSYQSLTTHALTFHTDNIDLGKGKYYITLLYEVGDSLRAVGGDYFYNLSQFTVNESDFKLVPGKYVIVTNRDVSKDYWYYVTSNLGTASTKRLQAISTGATSLDDVIITNLPDSLVWELVKDGTNWKLKNGTKYLSWTSGNSATFDVTGKSLSFIIAENMVKAHFNDGTDERYLSMNGATGSNYLAFYKESVTNAIKELYFLPYQEIKPDKEYIIVARRSDKKNWFYLTAEKDGTKDRLKAVDSGTASTTIPSSGLDDKYYWTIQTKEDGVYLKSKTKQFISWKSGNTALLSADSLLLNRDTTSSVGNNLFYLVDKSDASNPKTRYLSLNSTDGNNYFAFYTGQIKNLVLIEKGGSIPTNLTEIGVNQYRATKVFDGTQLLIIKDGEYYDVMGNHIR